MPEKRRPWFRIYRFDTPSVEEGQEPDPDPHPRYRAFWRIDEKTYRVRVWSREELELKPETEVPTLARDVDGKGWMLLQPIDAK